MSDSHHFLPMDNDHTLPPTETQEKKSLPSKLDKTNHSISLLTLIPQIKAIPTVKHSPPIHHLNPSKCPHPMQAASLRSQRSSLTSRLEFPSLARLTPGRPRPDPRTRAMRQRTIPSQATLLDRWRVPLMRRSARRGVEISSRRGLQRKRDGHEI